MVMVDGSGLSRYNLTSPSIIIRLLEIMYHDSLHFSTFYNSLPIAGIDGTIADRMNGTPAQGNLRAKTGTLSAVSALSGYVHTADGEPLAFSVMMQNYPNSARPYQHIQDEIGILLSTLHRESFSSSP
jgi:serine-type D-Ala-D-Ala carboxypeptidase/endopeptidase (penicillin-binding protein 4)